MQKNPIRFTGNGSEYFQIWVSNLVMSILTLGCYSPWAKVRRMRYFYQNTHLANANFDYHGNPVSILKGRLVAIGLFFLYSLLNDIGSLGSFVGLGLGVVVLPYLISRSLRFRLRNTSYKNIRFRFLGTTKQAFYYYVFWQVLSFISAFLLFPIAQRALKEYQIGRSSIGKDNFIFGCGSGPFYRAYILAGLSFGLAFAIVAIFLKPILRRLIFGHYVSLILMLIVAMIIGFIAFASARAAIGLLQNDIWNKVSFRSGRFESWVKFDELVKIHFSNVLGLIITLGLYKPFADIKLAKYRLEHLALLTEGNLDDLVSAAEKDISAFGEETTDIFDIDLAL